MISLIWAMSLDNVIGINNHLPWHYKSDLQYFKEKTLNHKVLMGYNTYLSIKAISDKVLPNRECFVLYEQEITDSYVSFINDLDCFINLYQESEEEVFIIGGASIYKQCLPYAKYLYITLINKKYDGDTFFEINLDDYHLLTDEKVIDNGDELHFTKWEMKKSA